MEKVMISTEKIKIPTYPEPKAEELPMFAENRVHQRSTGRPYPNKVVLEVNREEKTEKEYTLVRLENEYIRIEILPEIGGRIYSAKDKITGYDFFYKQHVIKPALIGVLGSWISGGVEFNWPFHHRASGFMPCDFVTEEMPDGSAVCWLSEHDPIDRMKGMIGIVLRPGCAYFETRMKLYNRTPIPHSFLWWENAAVPVNEEYRIFFPQDVSYVNFHYLKSRASYPVAGNVVYNGIPMQEDRDISWHKNTRQATSYFASASDFDFFGGYDYGKQCGVVHIGDRYISPGKKMFTWAYCQLAKSWENALTDTDGQYAELMAGSYSDNQPNFSWLAPYETKKFSQYWYPIHRIGCPVFANLNCAFNLERSDESGMLSVYTTQVYKNAEVYVYDGEAQIYSAKRDFSPENTEYFELGGIPDLVTVKLVCDGSCLGEYTEKIYDKYHTPEPITDTPSANQIKSVQELYLAGVHVDQYRDPAVRPDAYWLEALKRDPEHIPSLISMARYEYNRYNYEKALVFIDRAISLQSVYNERPVSGEAYYVKGLILEALEKYKQAYDVYQKSAWAADSVSAAMTRIAILDIRSQNAEKALEHAEKALDYNRNNSLATVVSAIAQRMQGNTETADAVLQEHLIKDPLDQLARYLLGVNDFYGELSSSPSQTCLDLVCDLASMGMYQEVCDLLKGLLEHRPKEALKPVLYALGYYSGLAGFEGKDYYQTAKEAELGRTFPFRPEERKILQNVLADSEDSNAVILLGDLLYNKLFYKEAADLWSRVPENPEALRNLAVAYFSHLNREQDALSLMKKAMELCPDSSQLLYETVVLMDKLGADPAEKIRLLTGKNFTRDDLYTELAKAYNQNFQPDQALGVLMSHAFVPCEGGEHAIADQYWFAYLMKGIQALREGKTEEALEYFVKGQPLPQSLGAGIWNHCKLIPLKFHQAICLKTLGQTAEAEEIWEYIAGIQVEYFSNMHLKELPFYQASSLRMLGRETAAVQLITKYLREWEKIAEGKDSGFFGTTPFFISFVDAPEKLRRAQHQYLTALCYYLMGDQEEFRKRMKESAALNNENLFAVAAAEGYYPVV